MKRTILALALVVACVAPIAAQQENWALVRFQSLEELRLRTETMLELGLTPVGIDASDERGLSMLFSRVPWWPAQAYRVEEIPSLDSLTDLVTTSIRDGWLPMDITFQDDRYIVLFTDAPDSVDGWRVIGTEARLSQIQTTLSQYRGEGFTAVGLTAVDETTIAHLFLALPERDFPIPAVIGVPHDPEEAAAAIQSMVDDRWIPVGVTSTPDEIILAFIRNTAE
ncbi:MAG: hypothetical protein ACOC1U_01090 [Spirochaetota bacterium]